MSADVEAIRRACNAAPESPGCLYPACDCDPRKVLDLPTAEEIEWAATTGSECGCTGRCRRGPHFTCSGLPRAEEIASIVLGKRNADAYERAGYPRGWRSATWPDDVRKSAIAAAADWLARK